MRLTCNQNNGVRLPNLALIQYYNMNEGRLIEIYYEKCVEYINHRSSFMLIDIQPILSKLPKHIRGIIRVKVYKYLKHNYTFNKYTYEDFLNNYVYWFSLDQLA